MKNGTCCTPLKKKKIPDVTLFFLIITFHLRPPPLVLAHHLHSILVNDKGAVFLPSLATEGVGEIEVDAMAEVELKRTGSRALGGQSRCA